MDIEEVEPFQHEIHDWHQYTERLNQYFIANGSMMDEKKQVVFLTLVGTKTYSFCELIAPKKPSMKSYKDLKAILKDYFKSKPLIISYAIRFAQVLPRRE